MLDIGLLYIYCYVEVHVYHLFCVNKSYILVRMAGKYDLGVQTMDDLLVR